MYDAEIQIHGRDAGFYKYILAWVYRDMHKNRVIELLKRYNIV